MRTIHEVSKLTGVSIRALQYYDKIGLLRPAGYTGAGYRLYDDTDLEKLQQILLFRELEFPLKDIKKILDHPDFDRDKALEQQIALLTLKKEHLENLIVLARETKLKGMKHMDFKPFDTSKIDEYAVQAKEYWGNTPEYKEFEEKQKSRTPDQNQAAAADIMKIFQDFGHIKTDDPASETAQTLVKKLQEFISANYYTYSKEILNGLGKMYAAGGDFTKNIDAAGGEGTAEFAHRAIKFYCR